MQTPAKSYKTIEELLKNHNQKNKVPQSNVQTSYDDNSIRMKKTLESDNPEDSKSKSSKTSHGSRSPYKNAKPNNIAPTFFDFTKPGTKTSDQKSLNLNKIIAEEEDERFRYLLKYGNVKRIEKNNAIIFAELPQIPGTWVFYRKSTEREENSERLLLENKELSHIPLMEGEEKLKLLSLKHNRIEKIQNLVSLPHLIYLDLYDNQIAEIENLQSVLTLRVLMMAKNRISKITNIEILTKLDVLDLHSNLISKIDGLRHLTDLRILNLANNSISKIDELSGLTKLTELNLKINQIDNIEPLAKLKSLTKLYLAKNKISKLKNIKILKGFLKLSDLTLEDNPFAVDKKIYYQAIFEECDNLQTLDYQNVKKIKEENGLTKETIAKTQKELSEIEKKILDELKDPKLDKTPSEDYKESENLKQSEPIINEKKMPTPNKNPKPNNSLLNKHFESSPNKKHNSNYEDDNSMINKTKESEDGLDPETVIKIIEDQFNKEILRVERLKKNGITSRKEIYKESILEGGHAEIENNTILYLYGNSFEVMIPDPTFQNSIETIHFEFVIFEMLTQSKFLNFLKQFKKLSKLIFKNNYITSFLQIAKLEILPLLRSLTIKDNPILSAHLLKEFIVYRFPDLKEFNGIIIDETHRTSAKSKFKEFDNILMIPTKLFCENVKGPQVNKTQEEAIDKQSRKIIANATQRIVKKETFELCWGAYLNELVLDSLNKMKVSK